MRTFKYDLAASVLLEAVLSTDEKACAKYGLTQRTLFNYRKRLAEDPKLSDMFLTKKEVFNAAWAESMPAALTQGIQALETCFKEIRSDPSACKNPTVLHALAGAFRIVAEVHLTIRVIEARMGGRLLPAAGETKFSNSSRYTN